MVCSRMNVPKAPVAGKNAMSEQSRDGSFVAVILHLLPAHDMFFSQK